MLHRLLFLLCFSWFILTAPPARAATPPDHGLLGTTLALPSTALTGPAQTAKAWVYLGRCDQGRWTRRLFAQLPLCNRPGAMPGFIITAWNGSLVRLTPHGLPIGRLSAGYTAKLIATRLYGPHVWGQITIENVRLDPGQQSFGYIFMGTCKEGRWLSHTFDMMPLCLSKFIPDGQQVVSLIDNPVSCFLPVRTPARPLPPSCRLSMLRAGHTAILRTVHDMGVVDEPGVHHFWGEIQVDADFHRRQAVR